MSEEELILNKFKNTFWQFYNKRHLMPKKIIKRILQQPILIDIDNDTYKSVLKNIIRNKILVTVEELTIILNNSKKLLI